MVTSVAGVPARNVDPVVSTGTAVQFHDQRRDAVGAFEAVNRGDVRMVQRGEHFLALEPREAIGVTRHRGRQDLDGDRALQVRVGGAIHLSHSAGTNLGGDLIGTDAGAWGQRHGCPFERL